MKRNNLEKEPDQEESPAITTKRMMTKTVGEDFSNQLLKIGKNGLPEEDNNHKFLYENNKTSHPLKNIAYGVDICIYFFCSSQK